MAPTYREIAARVLNAHRLLFKTKPRMLSSGVRVAIQAATRLLIYTIYAPYTVEIITIIQLIVTIYKKNVPIKKYVIAFSFYYHYSFLFYFFDSLPAKYLSFAGAKMHRDELIFLEIHAIRFFKRVNEVHHENIYLPLDTHFPTAHVFSFKRGEFRYGYETLTRDHRTGFSRLDIKRKRRF